MDKDELIKKAVDCFLEHLPPETDFFKGYSERGLLTNTDVERMVVFLCRNGMKVRNFDISGNDVAEEIARKFLKQRSEPVGEGEGMRM